MMFDSAMIVAIVVLVLFGFVYFVLFFGMYRARKRTLFSRLEDDDLEKEIDADYSEFIETKGDGTFAGFLEEKERKNKVCAIVSGLVCAIISLACIALLVFSLVSRAQGDQVFFGDKALLVIRTGSMSERNKNNIYLDTYFLDNQIEQNTLIAITRDYDEIHLYDIVAFQGEDGETLVHRCIGINEGEDGAVTYNFRGDSNAASFDYELCVTPDRIIGVYTGFHNLFMGQFVVYMQSGIGIISVVVAFVVVLSYYLYCDRAQRLYQERYEYLSRRAFVNSFKWDAVRALKWKNETLLEGIQLLRKNEKVMVLTDKNGYHAGDTGVIRSVDEEGHVTIQMDNGGLSVLFDEQDVCAVPMLGGLDG